jgi:hypothetical protein
MAAYGGDPGPIQVGDRGQSQVPYKIALIVGTTLVVAALLVAFMKIDFPYINVLIYAGIAIIFSGIGANAAVSVKLPAIGQAGSAVGALAIAILLFWTIGPDTSAKFDVIYYINFPDGKHRNYRDLKATVDVLGEREFKPESGFEVPVTKAPGGDSLTLTVPRMSARQRLILRIHSDKENKDWSSSTVRATESFMNVNDEMN